ncbi:MAG: hypothetical protein ACMXX9_04000 [Candidatus Woesearchaeota archaeon]
MNKKGMEFAVGTVVAIVLGLAMFIAGTMIFYNIYDAATSAQQTVDQNVKDQVLRSFSGTNPLYLPQTSITINREREIVVYFAVQNNNAARTTFGVEITHDSIFDNKVQYFDEITVNPNSRDVGLISINLRNVEPGQYVFTVRLSESGSDYGNARVFTINI